MRIIITKTGEILIKENVPQMKLPLINQNNTNKKKYYLKNNLSTITKNENVNFPTINKEKNYKEIKLSPNNLNLPINMEEKYYDQKYDDEYNNNSNIIETSFNNSSSLKKNYYLKEILSEQNQKRFINKINFNKKVNFEDVNLINYLKSNRPISPRLIKKISNSN